MKKLLSLPPNLVECFHDIMHADHKEWFCTSDPVGKKLGSGGGTAWLLNACREEEDKDAALGDWLAREKRILLHAGGQSRRLPGYAPSGKVLTPIPVFRWARGQRITQDLLSLQLPLYEEIMERAPEGLRTLIASGDVYIRATEPLQEIPDVDVVCYGLWVDPELAKNHGVFVSSRKEPEKLDFMLQKPSVEEMGQLMQDYLFLMDIGIWLLSDRAIELMVKRSTDKDGGVKFYDMYSEFGLALGAHPRIVDEELNRLKVAILTMPGPVFFKQKRNGLNDKEFYCYKFRSMRVNTQADSLQATKDDPRKTRWGNIMRKTSIDELPQFINVLLGDMSVVGPRPHMLKHTEEYSKLINKYMVRHFVKPGITGWSQVTGYRGETKELKDMEGRIRGDIWYIEHWSFGLDLFIIYKTVANAIHGEKNAY